MKRFLIFFCCLIALHGHSQPETSRKLSVFGNYQFLKEPYVQFGVGFDPKKHLLKFNGNNEHHEFVGYRLAYQKNTHTSDWGIAGQCIALGGDWRDILAVGIDGNYRSIAGTDHYGLKPLIGISFPFGSLMYGYNFDLGQSKATRFSQHELILEIRFQVKKW